MTKPLNVCPQYYLHKKHVIAPFYDYLKKNIDKKMSREGEIPDQIIKYVYEVYD